MTTIEKLLAPFKLAAAWVMYLAWALVDLSERYGHEILAVFYWLLGFATGVTLAVVSG